MTCSSGGARLLVAGLAAAMIPFAALAADPAFAPLEPPSQRLPRIPPPTTDLPHLRITQEHACGGVGVRDREAIEALAPDYDLVLAFANGGGDARADVRVRISDEQGRLVLAADCDAPLLLLRLPPGRYALSALAGGQELRRQVAVSGRGPVRVVLRWREGR
jgi:hypothetical protein